VSERCQNFRRRSRPLGTRWATHHHFTAGFVPLACAFQRIVLIADDDPIVAGTHRDRCAKLGVPTDGPCSRRILRVGAFRARYSRVRRTTPRRIIEPSSSADELTPASPVG
jgi:hypothetical protein